MGAQKRAAALLLVALLASLAPQLGTADLYGNGPSPPAPPPPFAVKGKTFPPESTLCMDPATACFGKDIQCPAECPMLKPADSNAKACFIDCSSPKCEAVCKHRKPNCEGNGAACYDPRFVGGDGVMFYFHGRSGHHYALVSDPGLQINARFVGHRPAGRPRDFTWIQAVGVMFGPHTFTLEARRTPRWDGGGADRLALTYDGAPLALEEGHLASWSAPDGRLAVERTARVNSVAVTLPRVFEVVAAVVPVTAEDDRIHGYGIPAGDCFAHLEVQFRFLGLSGRAEGVLGQTYRPDFQNPVKRGVPMPVMSGEHKYWIPSLLSADCKHCIFSSDLPAGTLPLDYSAAATTLDCTGKTSGGGYGVVCRR